MDEIITSEPKIEETKPQEPPAPEPKKMVESFKEEPDSKELSWLKKIFIIISALLVIAIFAGMTLLTQIVPTESNFCGQEQKHYGLELSYYINASTYGLEANGTKKIPILAQTNCMTYGGLYNETAGIYSINDTALFDIFNSISLQRCKDATNTFKNDISCNIYNGSEFKETIFPYEG